METLEDNLVHDLDRFVNDLKPDIVDTLLAKAISLPEDAKLRWKKELQR